MHFVSTGGPFLKRIVANVRTFGKSLIPIRAGGKVSDYTETANVSHFGTIHSFRLDGRLISEKMVENVRTFDKSLISIRAGGKWQEYTESANVSHFGTIHLFRLDGRLISKKNGRKHQDIQQISDPYKGWRQMIPGYGNI